jgi:hypothetical protein
MLQEGCTPLSWLAAGGHLGVVEALLDSGANVDARDDYVSISWAIITGVRASGRAALWLRVQCRTFVVRSALASLFTGEVVVVCVCGGGGGGGFFSTFLSCEHNCVEFTLVSLYGCLYNSALQHCRYCGSLSSLHRHR